METTIDFNFDMVPPTMAVCFLPGCPLADHCIRHLAGKSVPADKTLGPAIYPTALNDGKCSRYKQTKVVIGAWGFTTLFENVLHKDNTPLRDAIKHYLGGHGTYYRYHNGSKLLMPEQQRWVIDLFNKHGYNDNLKFDHYKEVFDFSLS